MKLEDWQYWKPLFKAASEDELDDLHARYLSFLGYEVGTLKLIKDDQIQIPKIGFFKDEVIKKIIFARCGVESVLVIGYWDARFIFNIGLSSDLSVHGLDCYTPSVENARKSLLNLPREVAERFKFFHGLAGDLSDLPDYDIVVNICLEHIHEPRQTLLENLSHIKDGGALILAVPIGNGCDSPNHLWHWQEQDLRELIPFYKAKFIRTKFTQKSNRNNYFVIVVNINKDNLK